jgi:hypothetical protein
MTDDALLSRARAAAYAYCRMHDYGDRAALEDAPVLGPLNITRDGRTLSVYRWLGHGRGADFVQVEIDSENGDITVLGAHGDQGLPSWQPNAGEL